MSPEAEAAFLRWSAVAAITRTVLFVVGAVLIVRYLTR